MRSINGPLLLKYEVVPQQKIPGENHPRGENFGDHRVQIEKITLGREHLVSRAAFMDCTEDEVVWGLINQPDWRHG